MTILEPGVGLLAALAMSLLVACSGSQSIDAASTAQPATTRRTTTIAPASTDEACSVRATAFALLIDETAGWFYTAALQAEMGDLHGLRETYDLLKWSMADLPDLSRELLDDCGHHLPESEVRAAHRGLRRAESGWRDYQALCRSDLATLGFDC